MPGPDIAIRLKENKLRGIQFILHVPSLEHLVYLPVTENGFARNRLVDELAVGILTGQLHICSYNPVGQSLHALKLFILVEVVEVKGILGANAIGIPEQLIVHAIKSVLILGHVLANDMLLRQDKRRKNNDHLAIHRLILFAAEERSQQGDIPQNRHLVDGALLVLRYQAANDERCIIGHPHVGPYLPSGKGRRAGKNHAFCVPHLKIRIGHHGRHLSIDLHTHLLAFGIDSRPQGQGDADLLFSEARALVVCLGITASGYGHVLRYADVGHPIIQCQYTWPGKNFSLPFTHQCLDLGVQVVKNPLGRKVQCRIGRRIPNATDH